MPASYVLHQSPPPTRGRTLSRRPARAPTGVAPAHAGMDPPTHAVDGAASSRPRPRGDGPHPSGDPTPSAESPPPTRGWTHVALPKHAKKRVAPAHAGMDPSSIVRRACRQGRPRPRGDGPHDAASSRRRAESPPPTRGWTRRAAARPSPKQVAPAHAGMDPIDPDDSDTMRSRPRPRGDGPRVTPLSRSGGRSPPPTRGWTRHRRRTRQRADVAPAHAGMDPRPARSPARATGCPRPRGDGPTSPLRKRSTTPVAPAHAGMDRGSTGNCSPSPSRPSPRGDGPQLLFRSDPADLSPPPTRG